MKFHSLLPRLIVVSLAALVSGVSGSERAIVSMERPTGMPAVETIVQQKTETVAQRSGLIHRQWQQLAGTLSGLEHEGASPEAIEKVLQIAKIKLRGLRSHVRLARTRFETSQGAVGARVEELGPDSDEARRLKAAFERLNRRIEGYEALLTEMSVPPRNKAQTSKANQIHDARDLWRGNLARIRGYLEGQSLALPSGNEPARRVLQPAPLETRILKGTARPRRLKPDNRDRGSLGAPDEHLGPLVASIDPGLVMSLLGSGIGIAAILPPEPVDTQPSADAQSLHPDISAIVAELGEDPVAIYNFVMNEIDYVPYYGSRLGAVGTLAARAGNSWDQSSLLIALLRGAGFPARYAWGEVQVPIVESFDSTGTPTIPGEGALNWLGVTTGPAAASILTAGGHPLATLNGTDANNDGVVEPISISKEHCWVFTQVPMTRYRGRADDGSEQHAPEWVHLDPSVKRYTYTAGVQIPCDVDFDYNYLGVDDAKQYLAEWRPESPLEFMEAEIVECLRRNPQLRCETLQQTWKEPRLVRRDADILPASPQVHVREESAIQIGADFPDSYRTFAEVSIPGMSTGLRPLAALHDTSITVEYPQDSSGIARAQLVLNAIDTDRREEILPTPGALQPVYVPGVDIHNLTVTIEYPQPPNPPSWYESTYTHNYRVRAGGNVRFENSGSGVHAVALSPVRITQEMIRRRSETLGQTQRDDVPLNALEAEALHVSGLTYLRNLERDDERIGAPHHYRYVKNVFHVLVSISMTRDDFYDGMTENLFSGTSVFPGTTPPGARFIVDAGELPATFVDIYDRGIPTGSIRSSAKLRKMMALAGFNANYHEHQVIEQTFNINAISAVRGIQAAQDPTWSNNLNILRLQIDDQSADPWLALPEGPIRNALANDYWQNRFTIITPESTVTYSRGTYQVAIVMNPDTGASRFIVLQAE